MKNVEKVIGFILIILIIVLGKALLASDILFFRLLVGAGIGYTLSRAYTGFAGSVNRALRTGSTKLMRTMMFMFFIAALLTTGLLFRQDATTYNLWINPINLGLVLGGLLFGFGMAFASCCASGVMTDLVTGLPRALITLLFFMMGVFLGYPLQYGAAWVNRSWLFLDVEKASFHNGIFLPDLFRWDGTGGYIGALLLTGVFCALVAWLATLYEKKRKLNNTFSGVGMEKKQAALTEPDTKEFQTPEQQHIRSCLCQTVDFAAGRSSTGNFLCSDDGCDQGRLGCVNALRNLVRQAPHALRCVRGFSCLFCQYEREQFYTAVFRKSGHGSKLRHCPGNRGFSLGCRHFQGNLP